MDIDAEIIEVLQLLSREAPGWDSMTMREQWDTIGDYYGFKRGSHDRNFPRYVRIVAKMASQDATGKTAH